MWYRIISSFVLSVVLLAVASCSAPQGPTAKDVVHVGTVEPPESVAAEPQPPKVEPTPPHQGKPKPPEVAVPEIPSALDQLPESNASDVVVSLGEKKLTMQHIWWKEPNPRDFQLVDLARSWVETELLYAEAEKRGLTNDPQALFLAEMNRKSSVIQLLRMQVGDAVEISDEQVQAFYEERKQTDRTLQQPGYLSFTHITTRTKEDAQKVLERLKAGEDIHELAKELSTHNDASKGGIVKKSQYKRLEMQFGDDLVEELLEAEQGQLVGPIELERNMGFEVARKEEDIKPMPWPFEKVRGQIRSQLERAAKYRAFKALVAALVEQAGDKIVKSQRLIEAEKTSKERSQPRRPTPTRIGPGLTRPRPRATRPPPGGQ